MESTLTLRFFGKLVCVHCDDGGVARALALVYERQVVSTASTETDAVHVRVDALGADGPRVLVGNRTVRAPSRDQLLHYAHLVLVNAAAASASDLLVLHAGAVERHGRAVVVVAPSGGGKTTVTLALARRGWRVLSDDFAVIDGDAVVHPFVRRLNVTDDTLRLLGADPPPGAVRVATSSRGAKWMTDPVEMDGVTVGRAARMSAVFVLEPREGADEARTSDAATSGVGGERKWRLLLDHAPASLEPGLNAIEGVRSVSLRGTDDGTIAELMVDHGARIVAALDGVLGSHDVTALSVSRPALLRQAPAARPCLERLSLEDTARATLPHDLGLSGRRFLYGTDEPEVASAWSRLSSALAAVGHARYRLWPGGITDTIGLIEEYSRAQSPGHD